MCTVYTSETIPDTLIPSTSTEETLYLSSVAQEVTSWKSLPIVRNTNTYDLSSGITINVERYVIGAANGEKLSEKLRSWQVPST